MIFKDKLNNLFLVYGSPRNTLMMFIMMFIMPILLWVYIFNDFINGSITLNIDSYDIYSSFKYFYNNLFNGIIPIWDPFVESGIPYVFISITGVLSPFMALFASLHFLGVDYYTSFVLFIIFYFVLGLAGFYLLALEVLKNHFYAWLAFVAFLFSGMGPMLFNQLNIYLLFCPVVWFFYFLFCFSKKFEPKFFIAIIFALVNILSFYIPFYFLTLSLLFIFFLILIFPGNLINFVKGLKSFIYQNKKIFFASIVIIIFALIPLILFKISSKGGDVIFLTRHASFENIVFSENALNKYNTSLLTFNDVSGVGTLGERMNLWRLFSNLDKYFYGSDGFIYIPVFIYILIFVTAFVSFGRKQLFILCLGLSVFLLSLGQATPLHKILYDTFFYFKYFRMLYFFIAFLIPIIILFAMFQLKELVSSAQCYEKRWQNVFINTFLHFCFLCLLYWQGSIIVTTYITLIFSWMSLNFLFFKPKLLPILFFIILLLEPIQVFTSYARHSSGFRFSAPAEHVFPSFSYERPSLDQDKSDYILPDRDMYKIFWYDMIMRDSKGYITDRFLLVSKFTYLLSKTIDEKTFSDYIHYKFYIYDRVQFLKDFSNLKIEEVFKRNENLAFVSNYAGNTKNQNKEVPRAPLIILRNTEQFKVIDFNPNRIRLITNFNTSKFLVYTDSYEKYWKVFINKHEQKLYRANEAFKGVWLPAGRNDVVFQYSITGAKGGYLFTFLFNILFLMYFLRVLCLN